MQLPVWYIHEHKQIVVSLVQHLYTYIFRTTEPYHQLTIQFIAKDKQMSL